MLNFVIKRLFLAIPSILLLIIVSFLLMHSAPGGPFTSERAVPPEILANLEAKYGLDKSLPEQMFVYIKNVVLHFDFGPSFSYKDRTVNEVLAQGFPI